MGEDVVAERFAVETPVGLFEAPDEAAARWLSELVGDPDQEFVASRFRAAAEDALARARVELEIGHPVAAREFLEAAAAAFAGARAS